MPAAPPEPTVVPDCTDDLPRTVHWRTALVGVTAAALLLRMFRLDEWALWVDEAHTFRDVTGDPDAFWERSHVSKYPLSYLMLRMLLDVLPSTGEGWLRLPFAVFGILTVPLLAVVGRAMVGARAALVAASFLALHPWHIYWSQNVRSYPMVLFFAVAAAGLGYRAMRMRSVAAGAGALGCSALAGFCHPSGHGMLFVLAVFAFLALRGATPSERRRFRRIVVWTLAGSTVLALVLFPLLQPAIEFFARAKAGSSPVHLAQTMVFFLRVTLIPTGLAGLWLMLRAGVGQDGGRARQLRHAGNLVLSWALLPPLLLLAATFALGFKVTAQYAFTALPAWCLGAAVGVVASYDHLKSAFVAAGTGRAFDRLGARAAAAVLGVIVAADFGAYDVLYFSEQYGDRPRWREGAQTVLADAGLGPVYVLTTNYPSLRYYVTPTEYWGRYRPVRTVVSIEDFEILEEFGGDPAAWLAHHRGRADDLRQAVYVVSTLPELDQKHPGLDALFRERGKQIGRFPCWVGPKDMTVQVFRIDP